ncbi:MAG: tRNA(Met) cytidine acetate ligase [Oscillospiraceae bacterium]|jgi:predicted nucleotidyltransferase
MLTAGIISEYNPFHLGHEYLIQRLRAYGATHIVAVMSGNFVQRGEAAILSKYARVRQALMSGVDLVIELPLPWAAAGAERFALGGVSLLDAIGVDIIGFGSECGSIDQLQEASHALFSPRLRETMLQTLKAGKTFAAARQSAVEQLYGKATADLLRSPNNILGIEYLKAIQTIGSNIKPLTIRRYGAAHDAEDETIPYASSKQIRALLRKGRDCSFMMPQTAFTVVQQEIQEGKAPASLSFAERAVLARLRCMTRDDFSILPDISEGLENRIYNAVRQATDLKTLYFLAKTKRYPLARIRRVVLSAFLGIKNQDTVGLPPYIRILGIGSHGAEILQKTSTMAKLPIISRVADFSALDQRGRNIADLESRAMDLYALCMPKIAPCGLDRNKKLITF